MGKATALLLVISLGVAWLSDKTHYAAMGVAFVVMIAFQAMVGQYIPIKNRHKPLLSEYGDTYVA